jgi:hypothetical protein
MDREILNRSINSGAKLSSEVSLSQTKEPRIRYSIDIADVHRVDPTCELSCIAYELIGGEWQHRHGLTWRGDPVDPGNPWMDMSSSNMRAGARIRIEVTPSKRMAYTVRCEESDTIREIE